jgi:hypothetical protein
MGAGAEVSHEFFEKVWLIGTGSVDAPLRVSDGALLG